jgi:hypothetical protein
MRRYYASTKPEVIARPHKGAYAIVRKGKQQGAAGEVIHYARSKFAPPPSPGNEGDGLKNHYVRIRCAMFGVISAKCADCDFYDRAPRA